MLKKAATILLCAATLIGVAAGAHASGGGGTVSITIDESGNVTAISSNGPIAATSQLIADPGPGGLSSALRYTIGTPHTTVQTGDLILKDPITNAVSDVVRVEQANSSAPLYIYFYSDGPGPNLADTGLPTAYEPITYTVTETNLAGGKIGWAGSPTVGEPGFVNGFTVSFTIISDTAATHTPEPGSIAMFAGLSASALLMVRRRRRQ